MKVLTGILVLGSLLSTAVLAAPRAEYWAFWDQSDERNYQAIDYSDWDALLKQYVVTNHKSGINRFRYGNMTKADKARLNHYISRMASLDPRIYRSVEQKAYWMNLYNALSVRSIVENYPLETINENGEGYFDSDLWNEAQVKVAGKFLSLNDIEHRILRPIWKDHKVFFGLNCGTLGCPQMLPTAFTSKNLRPTLKQAGRDFVNHQRGVHLADGKLQASSLFNWYRDDFAKDDKTLLKVFAHYAEDRKALYLLGFQGKIAYNYDGRLNAP